jgi:hypothetical protein
MVEQRAPLATQICEFDFKMFMLRTKISYRCVRETNIFLYCLFFFVFQQKKMKEKEKKDECQKKDEIYYKTFDNVFYK